MAGQQSLLLWPDADPGGADVAAAAPPPPLPLLCGWAAAPRRSSLARPPHGPLDAPLPKAAVSWRDRVLSSLWALLSVAGGPLYLLLAALSPEGFATSERARHHGEDRGALLH